MVQIHNASKLWLLKEINKKKDAKTTSVHQAYLLVTVKTYTIHCKIVAYKTSKTLNQKHNKA